MDICKYIPADFNAILHGQNRLERIKKYIEENISTDLSATVIAEKFGLSVSSLLHVFKRHQLQSYQRYVEKVRMNKAMEMIRGGKWIQEIMDATGYKYRSTFHQAFKREFKHPPGYFGK